MRLFLRKSQTVLTIALGTVPVPLLLLAYIAEGLLPWVWVFPAAYVVLTILSFAVPGKLRVPYGIASVLLFLLPGLLVPEKPMGTQEVVWVVGGFYGLQLMLSLQIAGWEQDHELPVTYAGYCLVLHMIGQFLVTFDQVRSDVLSRVSPWITTALLVFAALVMLAMNRNSLTAVSGKRQSISTAIRDKNTLLTLGLFALALIAAWIPSIVGALGSFLGWILGWINKLMGLLRADVQIPVPTEVTTLPTENTDIGFLVPEKPGNSTVSQITFIAIAILAVAILVPVVILALVKIIKALRRGLQLLWKWLLSLSVNASDDYFEDEITDTREDAQQERTERMQERFFKEAFRNEQKMTPVERIRYRYRRIARKHKEWRPGNTARENLPAEAAAIYERARYSNHPMSEEDAAQFKADTRQM